MHASNGREHGLAARCLLAAALMISGLVASACGGGTDVTPWPAGDARYDFDRPDAAFELDAALDEISGLAVLGDGTLAAVQDEDGTLYVLDPSTGRIIDERPFGPPGDYEAVALGAGRLFILEAGGRLYRFDAWTADTLAGTEFDLDLPARCDAEGLRADPEGDRLLVSCKERSGPHLDQEKAIFAFDTGGSLLSERPAYALDPRAFTVSVDDHPVNEAVRSILSERVDLSGLKPSELALHPLTGEIFVLTSVRQAVLSMTRDGTITGVWKLDDGLLEQPEAMDFLPNGDLYVASEASEGRPGVLLRFDYRAPQPSSTP